MNTNTFAIIAPNALHVGAQIGAGADMSQDGIDFPSVRIIGVTSNMSEIEDKKIGDGRFFSMDESLRNTKVCVIGNDLKEAFFPNGSSPVGKFIKLRGIPLLIVGVEDKRGSFLGDSQDRHMYIPITLHNQLFNRSDGIQLHGKGANKEDFYAAMDQTRLLLRNRRQLLGSEEDTFGLVNVDEFNTTMDQFTGAIAAVVIPITMIILVVGGIVVMNIMLVSVTERTFEVGLRKAIGATRKQILLQFLIESSLLCIVGGIIGLLLAYRGDPAYYRACRYDDDDNDRICRSLGSRFNHYRCFSRALSRVEGRPARPDRRADQGVI